MTDLVLKRMWDRLEGLCNNRLTDFWHEDKKLCYNCQLTREPEDCGPAEIRAQWVDADGEVSDLLADVCPDCLDAGDSSGPGYRRYDEESWSVYDGD